MNIQNQTLKDGRKLCYFSYGTETGEPVFYFHGFPGSHKEVEMTGFDIIAKQLNIRIIAIDRPGYGDSENQKNRTLLDCPDDVAELADSLEIGKFSVLGYSGGGPFALSCAFKIPQRLKKVVVVSGMGTVNAPGFKEVPSWSIIKWPGFFQNIILIMMKKMVVNKPEKVMEAMDKDLPKVDLEAMNRNNMRNRFVIVLQEAFKNGTKGAKQDAKGYKQNWGFELKDIEHPIHVWHGEDDANVKIETAEFIASELPNCISNFYPNEGHLSLIANKSNEILETFIKAKP